MPKIAVLPGLIPACAGKTRVNDHGCPCAGAHPRVCGENAGLGSFAFAFVGSSPRVRGKHMNRLTDVQDARLIPACAGKTENPADNRHGGLIPACAGKTASISTTREEYPAHPRVCGENFPSPQATPRLPGSSPRVRGKRGTRPARRPAVGLIPACAGKTPRTRESPLEPGAHPRVCGEN